MPIIGVESLAFGVDDLALARRFWSDFGLIEKPADPSCAVFETAEGTTVVLQPSDSPSLPPSPAGSGNTVREVTWGVSARADLTKIRGALSDLPSLQEADGVVRAVDPNGYAIAFKVTERRPLPAADDAYNQARTRRRFGERARAYAKATPQMMSHVVFFTPRFKEAEDFYTKRLGFRITDVYPGHSMFFRAEGASEHHNLFFIHEGAKTGFHHVAFEVRSIHEVFGGGLNMSDNGWETLMGPGRHPVSSAYFWYFVNPCGGAAEYDWDSDVISDDWVAREWPKNHSTFAEWVVPDGLKRFQGFPPKNKFEGRDKGESVAGSVQSQAAKFEGGAAQAERELVRMMDERIDMLAESRKS